ncbi:Spermidine/putrescine import ATP-binding protein PotA [Propionispora sp. 2/2-37]|uniref:ABC transporter ATP-binding protein n=1 Tax=Propionispora sp. 2/2-37 TaxID=1677858 RepID=UPI0006C57432|nr:ABC transporter ATP-binding protein [Propionispora sp. 2/2-37]CUH96259.1 Spermidine/putrescine import ATP-binding protein PotA [Propionispora sp. 2/2-37]
MPDNMVQLVNVVKEFEDNVAVNQLSIDIRRGEFLTLLGPSGCGKTTALRMIAGFEQPTKGDIFLDGENVVGKPAYKRVVNTVFQNYALFPHMNVAENVAFGLKMKKIPKPEIKQQVDNMLRMVQLEEYSERRPDQLSGGQKQRVAIARALATNPKVLLLDEPLGALDLKLRKQMQLELKHLQQKLGITFIFVTHDQEEALIMSDRIGVMNQGRLEQLGTPDEIYDNPATVFVADFIGETNLFHSVISSVEGETAWVEVESQRIPVHGRQLKAGEKICLSVRPERIQLTGQPTEVGFAFRARLKERIFVGTALKTVVILDTGKEVVVSEPAHTPIEAGEMYVSWPVQAAVVIKTE